MTFEELLEEIALVPDERNYWFIRTDGGENYDAFYTNQFIGIGWNEINPKDLLEKSEIEIKKRISIANNYNTDTKGGRTKATAAYHKLKRFEGLKKNDLVIIPSRSSSRLAFGIIKDSKIYIEPEPMDGCDYFKRRKVIWQDQLPLSQLDPIFYKIIQSRHAISNIDKYANFIDNCITDLYKKQDNVHFILEVTNEGAIEIDSWIKLMDAVKTLAAKINDKFDFQEEQFPLSVQVSVRSPGKIEFRRHAGKTLIVLASIFSSCVHNERPSSTKVHEITVENKDSVDKINQSIKELGIKLRRINNS